MATKKVGTAQAYKECLRRLAGSFSGMRLGALSPFLVEKHMQRSVPAGGSHRGDAAHVAPHGWCKNGVDLRTVQELGGWATLSLIQRYAHVSPSRKAEAVERLVRNNSTTLFTTSEIQRIGNMA